MSTASRQPTVADQHRAALEQCDDRVEHELRQTLSQVRTIDLLSSLMGLATRVLAVVLLLALVDHWMIALPGWGRLGALLLLGLVTVHGLLFRVLPLLIWRINPLYAAEQIERSVPSLKNGLINYVLLRKHPEQVHLSVLGALGRSTATQLSDCDDQQVIDHGEALRSGYLLVIVFACFAIYTILSPKSPLQTLHRVVAPWGEIARPARVEFLEITPGSDEIYFSQSVIIKAQVTGVRESELVEVVFQAGQKSGPQVRVPMLVTNQSTWFELSFPPGEEGIQQDIYYRLEAGDAVSKTYTLSVLPTPTIVVKEITYTYPRYTGLKTRTVKDKADINALEGTRVTIVGRANSPIFSASLKLFATEASRPLTRGMGVDNDDQQLAANQLLLKLLKDRRTAEFQGYELEFLNSEKHRSATPIRHRITVTPDFAPEIELLEPQRPSIEVPLNGSLAVEVRAIDPDYGLSRVAVENTSDLPPITLLSDSKGLGGQFLKRFTLVPARLGLKVGDTYTFQLVAEDNRLDPFEKPDPNRSSTHSVTIEVIAADQNNAGQRPRNMDDPVDPDKPDAGDQPADAANKPQDGDQGDGGDGNPSDKGEPGDKGSNDGDKPADGSDPQAGDKPGEGDNPKPGDKPKPGDNPKPGDKPQPSDNNPDPGGEAGNDPSAGDSDKPEGADQGSGDDSAQPSGGGDQDKPGEGSQGSEQDSDSGDPHDGDVIQRVLDRIKKEKQQQLESGDYQQDSADGNPGAQVGKGNDPDGNNDKPAGGEDGEGGKPTGEPAGGDKKPAGNADPGDKPTDSQRKPGAGQDGDGNQRPAEGEKPGDNTSTAKKPAENSTGTPADGDKSAAGEDGDGNDAKKPADGDLPDKGGDSKPGESDDDTPKPTDKPGEGNPDNQQQGAGSDQDAASKPSEDGEDGDKGQPGSKQVNSNSSSVANNAGTASSGAAGNSAPGKSNDNPSGMGESGSRRPDARATGQQESEEVSNDVVGLPDSIPESDEARLDYAEKATNLVLEYLKDQQHDPDPELLKESGLTAEQLREMVSRYERLKRNAETSAEGKRELEEALQSLGLNPRSGRSARQYRRPERLIEGVSNAGTRSQPPAGFLEKFNAFKKGTALSDE